MFCRNKKKTGFDRENYTRVSMFVDKTESKTMTHVLGDSEV